MDRSTDVLNHALITFKDWVFMKDGSQYKAAYGKLTGTKEGYFIEQPNNTPLFIPNENVLAIQYSDILVPVKNTNIYFGEQ
ncbi:MAG: hypothetical protein ABFC57_06290 [Veillonellales bacterium]